MSKELSESVSKSQRFHDLDAVRALALMLGVVLHGVMSFMSPRIWFVGDGVQGNGANIVFYIIHIFRMTAFFVIAGFFSHLVLQKRGVRGFVTNRLKRIVLPFIVFWPLAIGTYIIIMIVANGPNSEPMLPPPPMIGFPILTHLWFLYALALLCTGAFIINWVTNLAGIGVALGHAFDKSIGVLTKSDLIIPVLATPVALVFYFSDHWMIWFGIKTPDYSLIPNPMATVAYGTAFAFGWWLHRRHDLLEHIANRFWAYGIVAITGTWWCLNYVGPQLSYAIPAGHEHPIYCLIYPLTAWAWTFALIGLARVTLKTEHPLIRYISESSYWIFIIHMPLLLILQYIVKDWVWPLELKAACIISATLLISILSYKFMVRDTFIGRLLSGRRRDVAEINTK